MGEWATKLLVHSTMESCALHCGELEHEDASAHEGHLGNVAILQTKAKAGP